MNNQNEIEALIRLIEDPNREIRDVVVNRLTELGDTAMSALERHWEKLYMVNQQWKIEDVIREVQFRRLKNEILAWRSSGGEDLLYGAHLVASIHYPEIKYHESEKVVAKIYRDIWLELNNRLTALEKIRVINYFVYNVYGFDRTKKSQPLPQLFLINHLFDTRKGSPILLGILYAELARRLGLPVYGVSLPKNFILCYYDEAYTEDPNRILFYINPFNKGNVLGREELEHFLNQAGITPNPGYFAPCSNIDILERLIFNLQYAYKHTNDNEKVAEIEQLMAIIRESNP